MDQPQDSQNTLPNPSTPLNPRMGTETMAEPTPTSPSVPPSSDTPYGSAMHPHDQHILLLSSIIIVMISVASLTPAFLPQISRPNIYRLGAYQQQIYQVPPPPQTNNSPEALTETTIMNIDTGNPEPDLADLEKDLMQLE